MAKSSTTKTTVDTVVVNEPTVDTVVEKMDEEKIEKTNKSINKKPLEDSEEIAVVSLIPNVSYKDSKTYDFYKWDEVGHVEYMTFDTLKNMWRNHKGYFKNMWLKPNDDRIINQFGLTKTFEKYEYLMESSNYTKKNIKDICSAISDTPNGLKMSVCNKIKNMVIKGEISDVSVIRTLEKHLRIDLIDFLE